MGGINTPDGDPARVVLQIRAVYGSHAEANEAANRIEPLLEGATSTEVVVHE